jgi:hypothetical protein
MTILVISNIAQWILLFFIMSNKQLPWIEFEWKRTFFGKVRYGFVIRLWKKTGRDSASGKKIIGFDWANPKLLEDKPYCKPKSLWAKPFQRK